MEPGPVLFTSTVLLAIAAAGGLLMAGMRFVGDRSPPAALAAAAGGAILNLKYHWKQLPLPKGLVVAHAPIAVLGFVLLVMAMATWAARAR
jgi:hypothetical protein